MTPAKKDRWSRNALPKLARSLADIRKFIVNNVDEHPKDITRVVTEHFGIARPTALTHVKRLVDAGELRATGKTKAREYTLTTLVDQFAALAVTPQLEEHITWQELVLPYLSNVEPNVRTICQYGFTEMVNNVISHSDAQQMTVSVVRTAARISISVHDDGIGVFQKIQQSLGLKDPRHALLELSKGKVTTDPDEHSGEGIFFTSRMFEEFSLRSGELFYWKKLRTDGWLINSRSMPSFTGTIVVMEISPDSERTTAEVFKAFSVEEDDEIPRFSRTHVPLALAKYPQEELISRSQARRILARVDRFSEVLLDFQGVEIIGQGFADEMFRVFRRAHPETRVIWIGAVEEVERMIRRVEDVVTENEPANGQRHLF